MAKRRMTAARKRQISLFQKAGARKRRGLLSPRMWDGSKIAPMGKTVTLYHRTTSYRARNILKTRKWKTGIHSSPYVFLSHGGVTPEEHVRGSSVVSVRVPRNKIHKEFHLQNGVTYYMANKQDVNNRPVKKVKYGNV